MVSLLAVGFVSLAAITDPVSAGKSVAKSREVARSYALESKGHGQRRSRSQRIYLPIGPSYIYYDYPYYYARGHYPTHIGGYVYYIPRSSGRCSFGYRRCVANWGYSRDHASTRRRMEACRCR
jgi:hypothetical protein